MLLSFRVDIHRIETFIGPVVTIVIAAVVAKLISMLLRRYIRRSSVILRTDPTNYSFLQNGVGLVVFLGALFFVFWNIPELHDVGKTLFAGAGILAAIVGFASQEAFSNIISGVFLVIYKPFRVGDTIKLLSNNQGGVVEDITMRHIIIKSSENRRLVVPNSVVSREQILNSSLIEESIQLFLEILIAYESDHNRAMEIIKEESLKHPLMVDNRSFEDKQKGVPPVKVQLVALDVAGVRLRSLVWTKNDADAAVMKFDLLKSIKERFDKENIIIAHSEDVFDLRKK
jgi:small conductance mechanosensitive channel